MCKQIIPFILFLLLGSTLTGRENTFETAQPNKSSIISVALDTLKAEVVEATVKDACVGELNGSFGVQIMGGIPPYQISWKDQKGNVDGPLLINNANDTVLISSLPPGNYTYTIFDGGFGSARQSFITQTPVSLGEADLRLNLTESSPISCFGEQDGALQATVLKNGMEERDLAIYRFDWFDADNDPISSVQSSLIDNLPFGTYSAIAVDHNGCEVRESFILDQPDPIQHNLIITKSPTCEGSTDGMVEVNSITGGTSPFSINWSNEETDLENQGLGIGVYSFILMDINGCIEKDTIELTSKLAIAIDSILRPVQCHNEASGEIILAPSITGAADNEQPATENFIFNWSVNAPITNEMGDSSFLVGLATGSYEVTITHADLPNGCQARQVFNLLNPPKLELDTLSLIHI